MRKHSSQSQIVSFSPPCDLELCKMALKINRVPLLYFKRCALFERHRRIKTGVAVRKRTNWVIWGIFVACNFAIWGITFKNNWSPLLCYFKLCAYFCGHRWIKSGETLNWGQNWRFFVPCDREIGRLILKNKGKNSAPLPCYFQLFVSFRSHLWIHSGVTVRKWPNWGKICFDPDLDLNLDLRPLTPDIGNYSWKYYKNGRCDRRTDRSTDKRTDGQNLS